MGEGNQKGHEMPLAWKTDVVSLLFDGGSLLVEIGDVIRLKNGDIRPEALAFALESLGSKMQKEAERMSELD